MLFFFVHLASTSFCANLWGFTFHSCGAVPVSLICLFSSRVFRWRGASTKLASTIFPWFDKTPAASRVSLKILNKPRITPFSISCSRNNQNVLLSGTLSLFFNPKNRLKLARSTIWYSNWSSERLYRLWIIRALNNTNRLNGGRPPFDKSLSSFFS